VLQRRRCFCSMISVGLVNAEHAIRHRATCE
jgi:hypothetical protein